MHPSIARPALALALAALLAGCSTLAPQLRDAQIATLLAERGGPAVEWSAAGAPDDESDAIDPMLAAPMTLDAAVRVAMLRAPRLREEYARLGLARAEVLEAVEIGNPRMSWQRMAIDGGGRNRSVGASLPLLDLLLLPSRARLANKEYERARYEVAGAVLGVVAEVESAWYAYVTSRQVAAMREAVAEGTEISAELAARFHAAGNISALQLAQEQAAASQARIEALHARADAVRLRLELHTLLGLRGEETRWEASDTLPLPVPREDEAEALVALARDGNLELLAARRQAELLADALGLTRRLRWIGSSEIGHEREAEASGERLRGPELSLELPIFNQGQARLAKSEAQLAEALARVQRAELSAENGVREVAEVLAAMREVVRLHREALVPQREAIVARQQERQNFMLIGVFELIQAKVAEYDAYQAYLEAVRDYWLTRVELTRIIGRRLPSDAAIGARTPSLDDILAPGESPVMDHSQHGAMDHSQHGHANHSKHSQTEHLQHGETSQAPPARETQKDRHEGHDMHQEHARRDQGDASGDSGDAKVACDEAEKDKTDEETNNEDHSVHHGHHGVTP